MKNPPYFWLGAEAEALAVPVWNRMGDLRLQYRMPERLSELLQELSKFQRVYSD